MASPAPPPAIGVQQLATASSLRASQNSRLPLWAHSLRTDTEVVDPSELIAKPPERSELKSLSHEGRVRFHTRQFMRKGELDLKKQPRLRPEVEEQLLYVALYRDKIADQQADLDGQKKKEGARLRRIQRLQAAAPDAMAEASDFGNEREGVLGEATGAEGSASVHEAAVIDAHAAAAVPGASAAAAAPAGAALPALPERRRRIGEESKKITHIASVTSAPGAGSMATEYMESKRLGKLFDEWKMCQDEEEDSGISPNHSHSHNYNHHSKSSSIRFGKEEGKDKGKQSDEKGKGKGRGGGTPRHSNAGGGGVHTPPPQKAKKKPPQEASSEQRSADDDDIFSDDFSAEYGSDMSDHNGQRIKESKLASRLFQVVTNPKVTGEASGDGESTRKVPSYVEGFPTMNLMRLYRGPWRLEF